VASQSRLVSDALLAMRPHSFIIEISAGGACPMAPAKPNGRQCTVAARVAKPGASQPRGSAFEDNSGAWLESASANNPGENVK